MDHRSPLESIFNVISGLPQGHDKPVKHAFYNAIAIFLLVLCCAAGWALYIILDPFIKPLIWAVLVGSVLHPLKYKLTYHFQSWFESLEESRTPVMLGLLLLPINIVHTLSDFIGSKILKYIKIIVGLTVASVLLHVVYFYTPRLIICLIWKFGHYTNALFSSLINNASAYMMLLLLIFYISSMVLLWKPNNNMKFHIASTIVWLVFTCFLAHQFGSFQIPIFTMFLLIIIGGFIFEIFDIQEELNGSGDSASMLDALKYAFKHHKNLLTNKESISDVKEKELNNDKIGEQSEKNEEKKLAVESKCKTIGDNSKLMQEPWSLKFSCPAVTEEPIKKIASSINNTSLLITDQGNIHVIQPADKCELLRKDVPKFKRSYSQSQIGLPLHKTRSSMFGLRRRSDMNTILNLSQKVLQPNEYASDFYIYSVLWACGIMLLWKNTIMLPILPIPILIYVIKHSGNYLGLWKWLYSYWYRAKQCTHVWCCDRYDALVPIPIRGLYRIIYKANITLKNIIKDSIDTVASCVVIFGLIVFVVCASIFIGIQVYAEGIMLIQMSSNVINQTVVHNPELRQLLPPAFDDTVDSILDNAYQYGREGISKAVRGIMSDIEPVKMEKLEKQVLELWDRVYQKWMSSNNLAGPQVTSDAVENTWNEFVDEFQKSPEIFNVHGIIDFLKQNVGTLMSLLDSIWGILKGNVSIVLGSCSAFISVLLGGGTAVLNFILNLIIFFTTLFYLLSSSGDLYKPVELMNNFSPSGSRLGLALGAAVNSVFTASFKMAVFYGTWTWFIHNLFGVKIVYLPSAFAAILAAAPFLGTYWACIPAVFDLWLSQEKGIHAILFAIFQFLPTSIVDATIYSEIQGGHPYLTGLAIAGGIFCLGLEGAIVGPLLLCGLYVAMDLSTTFFKDSPSEESMTLPQLSRLEIIEF